MLSQVKNNKYIAINWLVLLFTLLVFFALVKLGLWQSHRAIEKEQRLEKIAEISQQAALELGKVLALEIADINDLSVSLQGEFAEQPLLLLDNQMEKGRYGFRVLQVFKHGSHTVLINLGWIAGDKTRQSMPEVNSITGSYSIEGHIRIVEKGITLAEQDYQLTQHPMVIQQIEVEKISTLIGENLLPFVVYLDKKEELGYIKNWQPIVMPPEKHRGYAFQWFSLAIAWLSLMIWAGRKVKVNHNNKKA